MFMAKVYGEHFERSEMGTVYAPDETAASEKVEEYIVSQYGNVRVDVNIGACIR